MQLVAYGAQDIYLTGNPQITFFKVVYRRHTNFSMEAIAQTFSGAQAASARVTSTISRNGDLISKMYYTFNVTQLGITGGAGAGNDPLAANIGHALFNEISLEIGGQEIDKHYGHWLTVWNELTEFNPIGAKAAVNADGSENLGLTRYQMMSYNHNGVAALNAGAPAGAGNRLAGAPVLATVPFQFWFNRNPGLALPLIALQYHEVKVHITFAAAGDVGANGGFAPDQNGQLWVDYIYLDTDERRRFAQQSHEYLIEQLQFQQTAAGQNSQLNFNHPVKELIWTGQPAAGAHLARGLAHGHQRNRRLGAPRTRRVHVVDNGTGHGAIDRDGAVVKGRILERVAHGRQVLDVDVLGERGGLGDGEQILLLAGECGEGVLERVRRLGQPRALTRRLGQPPLGLGHAALVRLEGRDGLARHLHEHRLLQPLALREGSLLVHDGA